jgi:3-oxoacyl-[acyl-carrier-protein] synthase II
MRRRLRISSTKSQLGHTLGASGGIELIATIKSMERSVIAPTINLDNPDPDCDLDYTPNQPRECEIKVAMSNSFRFRRSQRLGHRPPTAQRESLTRGFPAANQ